MATQTQSSRSYNRVFPSFLLIVLAILCTSVTELTLRVQEISSQTGITPSLAWNVLFGQGTQVQKENDRTNVLILGKGGEDHTASDLTDTILLTSVSHNKDAPVIISLPRDIWSVTLQDKVNSAYYYGKQNNTGGLQFVKQIVGEITGIPVHYVLVIDFDGFVEGIDILGGIDLSVPIGFEDTQYPIPGKEEDLCNGDPDLKCRYETVVFTSGYQHMDGTTALKYVRSRHATGTQGSDFARSKRQQEILVALKNKLMHTSVWFSDSIIEQCIALLSRSVETDMSSPELFTLGKLLYSSNPDTVRSISLDEYLYEPDPTAYKGRYVLIPTNGWENLRDVIHSSVFH